MEELALLLFASKEATFDIQQDSLETVGSKASSRKIQFSGVRNEYFIKIFLNLSKPYLKEKSLKTKKKMSCFVFLLMQSSVEGHHVAFKLKIKFSCHLINII